MEVLHPHCAGLDIHKDTVVACVRHMVDGAVKREVRTFKTTTKDLIALSEWTAATFGYSAFFDCGSHEFRVAAEPTGRITLQQLVN